MAKKAIAWHGKTHQRSSLASLEYHAKHTYRASHGGRDEVERLQHHLKRLDRDLRKAEAKGRQGKAGILRVQIAEAIDRLCDLQEQWVHEAKPRKRKMKFVPVTDDLRALYETPLTPLAIRLLSFDRELGNGGIFGTQSGKRLHEPAPMPPDNLDGYLEFRKAFKWNTVHDGYLEFRKAFK